MRNRIKQLKQMTGKDVYNKHFSSESALELNKAFDQEYVNLKFHEWLSKM